MSTGAAGRSCTASAAQRGAAVACAAFKGHEAFHPGPGSQEL
jgi:hypothetical protein